MEPATNFQISPPTLALQGSSDGPAVALGTFVFWPEAP